MRITSMRCRAWAQSGASFCVLFGTTVPFTADKLDALYPDHRTFVGKWSTATTRGVAAGFIRPADAIELIQAANQSDVGR